MSVFTRESRIVITCPKAASAVLVREVEALGFRVLKELPAGVEVHGSLKDCMRLNLHVRTGHRVLFLLRKFWADNPDTLYEQVQKVPWDKYISPEGYLTVSSSTNTAAVNDSRFANMRVKDAIVDQIRDNHGIRPNSGPDATGTCVFLHWRDDECRLYFDTSGEPLNRRGYRKMPWKAPMQETLAAAALLSTNWDKKSSVINPMCGSGTIAIEAALMALGSAPGLMRENYGFMHIPEYDSAIWDTLLDEAEAGETGELEFEIIASDISKEAVEIAYENAKVAGVERYIRFMVGDFRMTPVPEEKGIVIMNPEYGERLGNSDELPDVYKGIGDYFKQKCNGYTGYVFTGNLSLAKHIGLRARRRLPFYTAKIECRLLEYELYAGGRRN